MSQATIFYGEGNNYIAIPASQSRVILGDRDENDLLLGLLVIPTSDSPGQIVIHDGDATDLTVFVGGHKSIAHLQPFWIPLGIRSHHGHWHVSTGANMSVIAMGQFS